MNEAKKSSNDSQKKIDLVMILIAKLKKIKRVKTILSRKLTSKNSMYLSEQVDLKARVKKIVEEERMYVPDFVVKFNYKGSYSVFKKNQVTDKSFEEEELSKDRVNFYLTMLINAKFKVSLFSALEKGKAYCLLTLDEEELEQQCQNARMRMKLIDSYNFDLFDKKKKSSFEPFRSRQRQEIMATYLPKIIDLEMLKREGLVDCYFPTHMAAGLYRIRGKWVDQPSWYW